MKIHIVAPEGKKLRDIRTEQEHTEVYCDERQRKYFVLADGEGDPVVERIDGETIADKVNKLSDQLDAAKILLGVE